MVTNMREIGRMTWCMEKEHTYLQTVANMKGSLKMGEKVALE